MISISTFLTVLLFTLGITGVLVKVIWDVLNRRIDDLSAAVSATKEDIHEIKYNYLNRFDDMKTHISLIKEEIIEKITMVDKDRNE